MSHSEIKDFLHLINMDVDDLYAEMLFEVMPLQVLTMKVEL